MSENGTIQPVDQRLLVRLPRGRWLYAFSLDAEAWGGCCKNLEDAIEMAFREAADEEREAGTKIYFAHGCPMPKAECENLGLEWPWYQVDPKDAITILLPTTCCASLGNNSVCRANPAKNARQNNFPAPNHRTATLRVALDEAQASNVGGFGAGSFLHNAKIPVADEKGKANE